MEATKRIALLLVGFGVGEILAEEPSVEEKRSSPIFAPLAAVEPELPPRNPPDRSLVAQQLAALLRDEAAVLPPDASGGASGELSLPRSDALQLEKMTVTTKRLPAPPPRETALERFTRTGYLWEFSPTKRFMIGPKGDKVGIMFSFDW